MIALRGISNASHFFLLEYIYLKKIAPENSGALKFIFLYLLKDFA